MAGSEELKEDLRKALKEAKNESAPDNPVYRVVQAKVMKDVAAVDDTQKYILNRLESLESAISSIGRKLDEIDKRPISRADRLHGFIQSGDVVYDPRRGMEIFAPPESVSVAYRTGETHVGKHPEEEK